MMFKICAWIAVALAVVVGVMLTTSCGTHLAAVDAESVQVNDRLLLSNVRSSPDSGILSPEVALQNKLRDEAVLCSMRGIENRNSLTHPDAGPACK